MDNELKNKYAPIVVFAYNRQMHLRSTIEALAKNDEAKDSDLFIFSDGPKLVSGDNEETKKKNQINIEKVNDVRKYIKSLIGKNLFKSVHIMESQVNKGLANSVIEGVTLIIVKYGRVIVVEDDAVPSPHFLSFMNRGLDYYEKFNSKVWYIGGYSPKLDLPLDYHYDYYLMGRGSSYAWATWVDRWNKIDWQVKTYNSFKRNLFDRRKFNKFGDDRSLMLDKQMHHEIDSWAIRFSYEMFRNNMYVVLPTHSLIKTIGWDGSGTHTNNGSHIFDVSIEDAPRDVHFEDIDIDKRLVKQHVTYYKTPKLYLLKQFFKHVLLFH